MLSSIVKNIGMNLLRSRSPLLFLAIDIANAVITPQQPKPTIQEPESIIKARYFFKFSNNPTELEIKQKYKELAKIYHPDKQSGSEDKMKLLNKYKEELLNYYKE